MKLKRIYEYQGDASTALNERATARCPSCCPPEEIPEVPAAMGLPITAHTSALAQDCIVMDSSRYVIAVRETSATDDIRVIVVYAGADGVTPVVKTSTVIDTGTKTWTNASIAVTRFSETKFIVFLQNASTNPDEAYGIVCTLNADNTVTFTAPQLVCATIAQSNIQLRCYEIDSTHVIFAYQSSNTVLNCGSGAAVNPLAARVVTLGGSDVITTGAENSLTLTTSQVFDIASSDVTNDYHFISLECVSGLGVKGSYTTRSGDTITDNGASDALTHYSGATAYNITPVPNESGKYMSSANAVSGSAISLSKYNSVLDGDQLLTAGSTRTAAQVGTVFYNDIISSLSPGGTTRFVIAYGTSTDGTLGAKRVELEIFTYDGTVLTSQEIATIESDATPGQQFRYLRISNRGFSSTRGPVVYNRFLDNTLRTFIYELGSS